MRELVSLHVFLKSFMYETQLKVRQTGGNVELTDKKQNDIISKLLYFFQKQTKTEFDNLEITTEITHTKTNNKSSIKYQLVGQGEKIELLSFLPGNG